MKLMYIMHNRPIYILLFLILPAVNILAQDLRADLGRVSKFIEASEILRITVTTVIEMNKKKEEPYSQSYVLYKNHSEYYYRLSETEMFLSNSCLIMVKRSTKRVLYRPISKKESEKIARNMYTSGTDSLVSKYDSISYNGLKNNRKHYTIFSSKMMIQQTELYLKEDNGMIDQVIYYYNPALKGDVKKVDIYFKTQLLSPGHSELVNENSFVEHKDKNILKAGNKFPGYQIEIID